MKEIIWLTKDNLNYLFIYFAIFIFFFVFFLIFFQIKKRVRLREEQEQLLFQELEAKKQEEQRKKIEEYLKKAEEAKKVEEQHRELDEDAENDDDINYELLDYPFDIEDKKSNIVFAKDKEGNEYIQGATIYKLIEKLTEESGKGCSQYTSSFLLTYRSFSTPRQLLELLIKRYSIPILSNEDNKRKIYRKHIQLRVWYVLKYWTENHFYDFEEDPTLIEEFKFFLENNMKQDMEKVATQLIIILEKQINKQGVHNLLSLKSEEIPKPILPKLKTGSEKTLQLIDIHPLELARQLTLIEYDLYHKIQPKECLNQCWNKEDKEKQAPHIVELINRFNKTSQWVMTEILNETSIDKRAEIITLFIAIAEECKSVKNFNSMMGIVAGLMNSSISRLKKSWSKVEKSIVEKFENEYSMLFSKNFKILRDAVKQSTPPCLPYIGTYLADLTFIEDGNSQFIRKGKLINFEKRLMISKVISDLRVYQQREYHLLPVEEIQKYLKYVLSQKQLIDEKKSYQISLEREPREKK